MHIRALKHCSSFLPTLFDPSLVFSVQFLPLLAEANTTRNTANLRHPAISEPDDVILNLLNLAAKCIDKCPVARPTMAEVFSNLTYVKTALYGREVPT